MRLSQASALALRAERVDAVIADDRLTGTMRVGGLLRAIRGGGDLHLDLRAGVIGRIKSDSGIKGRYEAHWLGSLSARGDISADITARRVISIRTRSDDREGDGDLAGRLSGRTIYFLSLEGLVDRRSLSDVTVVWRVERDTDSDAR